MPSAAKQYDESLINFYDEQVVSQADTAYRFAFAVTLSLDGAQQCVSKAFRAVTASLAQMRDKADDDSPHANGAMTQLIAECWRAYKSMKGQKFAEGQSAMTKALQPLAVEARAALVAVDVAGLSPAEAAKALEWSEKDLRLQLAAARKALLNGTSFQ